MVDKIMEFDPNIFEDEIALKTSWTSLSYLGANISTHNLISINPDRYELKERTSLKAIPWLLGLVAIIASYKGVQSGSLLGIGIGVMFGIFLLYGKNNSAELAVFDKRLGLFIKKEKSSLLRKGTQKKFSLEKIYAFQVIPRYHPEEYDKEDGYSDDYYSYELNLVLSNGDRVFLIDQGNYTNVESQVNLLARFLNVPVWNKPSTTPI